VRWILAFLAVVATVAVAIGAKPRGVMVGQATLGTGLLDPVPATNLIDWLNYTGLEGNAYPSRTVAANLDNTASSSTINSTLAGLATNQVLLLTNKTFWLTNGSDVSLQIVSGRTLRGAGPGSTILVLSNNLAFGNGNGYTRTAVNIYSGATAGSSNIVVFSSPSDIHIGGPIVVCATNDWAFVHPYGYENGTPLEDTYSDEGNVSASAPGNRALAELTTLVSQSNGTNLTIWPPLSETYTNTPARIEYVTVANGSVRQWAGIENLTLRLGYNQVETFGAQNCWLSNVVVEIYGGDLPSVRTYYSQRILIEHCTFVGYNNRASAFVPYVHNSGARVQNCIFSNVYQAVIHVGRGGNCAFVYNYTSAPTNSTTALISEWGSHGVHVHHNLWEGIIGFSWDGDSIHGSGSKQLLFRDHFKGEVPGITTSGYGAIKNDSFQHANSFVSLTLGYSGMANWIYEEYAPGGTSTNAIFAFDYSGNSSAVNTGRYSRASAILHDIRHYTSGTLATNYDATRSLTIPDSYIFTNRPAWWGTNIPWPMQTNMNPAFWRAKTGTNSF
jgi:hypothetical protein